MSQEITVPPDDENRIILDPKDLCAQLSLRAIDPTSFEAVKDLAEENDWLLFESMDQVRQAVKDDSPGIIELDLEKDPDPFGNHGISILDRLAAMGWPADRMLIQDRREQVRPEDLL